MPDKKYPWIIEGEKLIGIHEATKEGSAAVDQLWRDWRMSGLVGTSTVTPWCSGYVGGTMTRAGLDTKSTNGVSKDNSQYWLGFGEKLSKPAVGCIVVFNWKRGGGHVGYVVGETKEGRLLVLGGNQGDMVKVSAFPRDEIVGYRWPTGQGEPNYNLPIGTAENITSTK